MLHHLGHNICLFLSQLTQKKGSLIILFKWREISIFQGFYFSLSAPSYLLLLSRRLMSPGRFHVIITAQIWGLLWSSYPNADPAPCEQEQD